MFRSPRRSLLLVALALPVLATACSDDSSASDEPDAAGKQTAESSTTTEAPAGKGSGTFVVGDRTYSFDVDPCTVDAGADSSNIQATGKGTFDNRPFTVTIRHSESETSAIENVQIVFSATEALVGTNFAPLPAGEDALKLKASKEGKAEGTLPVTGTGGQPSGDGQLTLECEG
jgi:hypothetical protein